MYPSLLSRIALFASLAVLASPLAQAQGFPQRSLELVVPYAVGGGTDALARAFGAVAAKYLKQNIVVVNKPGAGSAVGLTDAANAAPDGYKLGLVTVELTFLNSLGLSKITPDAFIPIARLNFDPSAITVKADAPWNTIEEFLAASKARPGDIKVGNAGNGSIWNLTALSLEEKAGVKFNQVPFKGAAPAVLALLGGHIDAVAVSPAEVGVYVASGKLKLLAVMSEQRVEGFESVPTLKERGIDVALGVWRGIAAPKGTPAHIVAILSDAAEKSARDPVFIDALKKLNLGYAYADAAAFQTQMVSDTVFYKELIDKLSLKP